jgi:DNA-binding NarL/FixJ family response regulator
MSDRVSEDQNIESTPSNSSLESSSEQDDRTQVFIVDDHPAVREALTSSINSKIDMRVIGESATAEGALRHLERHAPDIVVVDLSLEDAHGLDLVEQIRSRFQDVRILIYSMYEESVYAERAIRAGAMGYVMKSEAPRRVVEAVQSVSDGNVYLSEQISSRILTKAIRQQDYAYNSPTDQLTDREMTVFGKLGRGESVRDIAEELGLSHKTVETYRRRAKEKLGFDTVDELLQYAVQWGYGRDQDQSEYEKDGDE